MSLYILKRGDAPDGDTACFVHQDIDNVEVGLYTKSINRKKFWKKQSIIQLEIDNWEGAKLIPLDFMRWETGRPEGKHIICSPRFRTVLEKLHLPPHSFYDAEIDVLGETEHYFVLHFLFEHLDLMNFEQSIFAKAELMHTEPIEKLYRKGEISDKDFYNAINVDLIDNDKWIFPKKIVFPTSAQYDIFALGGSIVLTEKAKHEIEKAGITGLTMPPLSENDYWQGVEVEFADFPVKKPKPAVYTTEEEPVIVAEEPPTEYKDSKSKDK